MLIWTFVFYSIPSYLSSHWPENTSFFSLLSQGKKILPLKNDRSLFERHILILKCKTNKQTKKTRTRTKQTNKTKPNNNKKTQTYKQWASHEQWQMISLLAIFPHFNREGKEFSWKAAVYSILSVSHIQPVLFGWWFIFNSLMLWKCCSEYPWIYNHLYPL